MEIISILAASILLLLATQFSTSGQREPTDIPPPKARPLTNVVAAGRARSQFSSISESGWRDFIQQ